MASPKDKPRGYFQFLLAIDCETTGLNFNQLFGADQGHQAISWGIIVADAATLKPVEELYVEIKWNSETKAARKEDPRFGKKAEEIHGLTYEYLEKNGIEESEAVVQIVSLILKYFGTNKITTLGHNVHYFDVPFLRSMCARHGIELKFGNRHVDTNTVGFVNYNTFNSDDMFDAIGFEHRAKHNALDDVKMSLETARQTRLLFNKVLNA